jgi:ABC transporter transmembrane region
MGNLSLNADLVRATSCPAEGASHGDDQCGAVSTDEDGRAESFQGGGPAGLSILRTIFRKHRGPIALTYSLFVLENALTTAHPFALGLAIDGLIGRSYGGLAVFAALQTGHLLIGMSRRAYDTRMFSRIQAELATRLVIDQRRRNVEVTRIAARSALSREFADFFEHYVPVVIQTVFLMVGGLTILAAYDKMTVVLCVALVVPAGFLNIAYARRTLTLSGQLHDVLEREVDVIHRGQPREIHGHYADIARQQVHLSDSEALNFGMMDLFVTAVIAASLARCCGTTATPGEIMAVLRYVWMFVDGLYGLPYLIQQTSRLRDIGRRCTLDDAGT